MNYPTVFGYETGKEDSFELFASLSKYDIKQSTFYNDDTCEMIHDCFYFTLSRFRVLLKEQGGCFEDLVFHPSERVARWIPFDKALFYPGLRQPDRQVVLSEREIYQCENNRWTFKTVNLSEEGERLIGYIMKEMESSLRKLTKFKYKISANLRMCPETIRKKFEQIGIGFPQFVEKCVQEFHIASTRVEVSVNVGNLGQIRQEALQTQEKLIVPEAEEPTVQEEELGVQAKMFELEITNAVVHSPLDGWQGLKEGLTKIELEALDIILADADVKNFAAKNGIMLEVLVDEINQKAVDFIGDTILELDWDGSIVVYDEYRDGLIDCEKRDLIDGEIDEKL